MIDKLDDDKEELTPEEEEFEEDEAVDLMIDVWKENKYDACKENN